MVLTNWELLHIAQQPNQLFTLMKAPIFPFKM